VFHDSNREAYDFESEAHDPEREFRDRGKEFRGDEPEAHDEARTPLDACAVVAMQRGQIGALLDQHDEGDHVPGHGSAPASERAFEHDGFNVHASVRIAAQDDLGRERLCRYAARPPLALDRLRRLPDGRMAYRIKKLQGARAKHRIMSPLQFLARLSALVCPPRYPLLRYFGVLGPRSSWRRDVVPKAPAPLPACRNRKTPGKSAAAQASSRTLPSRSATGDRVQHQGHGQGSATLQSYGKAQVPLTTSPSEDAVVLAPNVLSVKHWSRLLEGALYAATPRVDWVTLLRRSFNVDVLACTKCGGRLRVLGEITEPSLVRLVLETLGLSGEAPPVAHARDPTELPGESELL